MILEGIVIRYSPTGEYVAGNGNHGRYYLTKNLNEANVAETEHTAKQHRKRLIRDEEYYRDGKYVGRGKGRILKWQDFEFLPARKTVEVQILNEGV